MPLHPLEEGLVGLQRQVQLVTVVRNEREAEQRAADSIKFGVEEVPQRCRTAVQSSAGIGFPLRQRSCAKRICLPRSSSCLRSSRPRFSSASFWLVVTASTPAEATFTGSVTTSTAVLATVPTTQPESVVSRAPKSMRVIDRTLQKLDEAAMTDQRVI